MEKSDKNRLKKKKIKKKLSLGAKLYGGFVNKSRYNLGPGGAA